MTNLFCGPKAYVILGFGPAVFVKEHFEGSVSAQQFQHYILILLSKLMIQTVSLDPDLTPFFNITRAIGVK